MTIIDAKELVLGRMASVVAKRLLLNEEIIIINAELAVITGNRDSIFEKYKIRRERGHKYEGPFFPKAPHRVVKRTIRGMIDWKSPKGKKAYKLLKVHIGTPAEFDNKPSESIELAQLGRTMARKFIRINDLSRFLGWKNPLEQETI
ncbi:MAG: 50S ribosomal protein L13 [Candidatus Altiarchaeota archaeon]|nr:50S ribosomal protein L13 [Candidatus Altiarchaeota archaeon]